MKQIIKEIKSVKVEPEFDMNIRRIANPDILGGSIPQAFKRRFGIKNGQKLRLRVIGLIEETQVTDASTTIVTHAVKALSEVKFDIVVENWDFTPMAQALVLGVRINELQNRHRLRINETTAPADGATLNRTRIGFGTEDTETAYFDWVPTYNVYDSEGVLTETNNVTTAIASYGLRNDHGAAAGEVFGLMETKGS